VPFDNSAFFTLLQVILIDIVLAGDNAIAIGMAAARVPRVVRRRVIARGLAAAVVMRVILALLVQEFLKSEAFMFAGGILLLWVSWRLYRDLKHHEEKVANEAYAYAGGPSAPPMSDPDTKRMMRRAVMHIAAADLSMSLDNVLAVAGAAMHHQVIMATGLLLSIGLMGVAASLVARLLHRHPWISYAGLFILLYVALKMVVNGGLILFYSS
jgi:YjbE family integral membrane protein